MAKALAIIVKIDDDPVMRYPGGKGKCFHQIINLMPPHHTYIEGFLGGGAVLRNKKPALRSIGLEIDPTVAKRWQQMDHIQVLQTDAISFLREYDFDGGELVYLDPPYVPSTRRQKRVYKHDMTQEHHLALLDTVQQLPCMVMISGYDNPIYEHHLNHWHKTQFSVNSHVGLREECVWHNFERPTILHDGSYVGQTFRERQTLKRRSERWRRRIEDMDPMERFELMNWMKATFGEARAT